MEHIVSVIIPVYNLENNLSDCLNSILSQTYKALQVLIINDGSKDGTSEICDYFSMKDNRITTINIKNSGVSNARNLGILSVLGDYVMFVDGDDTISDDWIESYVTNAIETNAEIVFGGITRITDGKFEVMTIESGILNSVQLWKILCSINTGFWIYGFVSNKMIKSSVLKDNQIFFDTTMVVQEDIDITIKILKVATIVSRIQANGYFYCPSLESRCCFIDLIKNKVNLLIAATSYSTITQNEIAFLQNDTHAYIIADLKQSENRDDFLCECQKISAIIMCPEYSKFIKGLEEILIVNNKLNILYSVILLKKLSYRVKSIVKRLLFFSPLQYIRK